jgi:predicted O-methyltransferase YrrM
MFKTLKQAIRQQLQPYIDWQVRHTAKDLDLARHRQAARESAEFANQFMRMAKSYPDKFDLLKAAIAEAQIPGLICEFGVYTGATINFIASLTSGEVHGFDSFEGLPEDWRAGHEKGTFAVRSLPAVPPNVRLYKGWFKDTIPPFKQDYSQAIAFLHVDADLYSSTKTVLDMLGDRIVAGTIIQFDEFFNYPGWHEGEGEYKAFSEFCALRHAEIRYLGFARWDEQVAVQIVTIAPAP